MHSLKDYLKLKSLTQKQKYNMTQYGELLQRGVLLLDMKYSFLTINEYPHKEYKHSLVFWIREEVTRDENKKQRSADWHAEYRKIYTFLRRLLGKNRVHTKFSLLGDSVKYRPHIHFFVDYNFRPIRYVIRAYLKIQYFIYNIYKWVKFTK